MALGAVSLVSTSAMAEESIKQQINIVSGPNYSYPASFGRTQNNFCNENEPRYSDANIILEFHRPEKDGTWEYGSLVIKMKNCQNDYSIFPYLRVNEKEFPAKHFREIFSIKSKGVLEFKVHIKDKTIEYTGPLNIELIVEEESGAIFKGQTKLKIIKRDKELEAYQLAEKMLGFPLPPLRYEGKGQFSMKKSGGDIK